MGDLSGRRRDARRAVLILWRQRRAKLGQPHCDPSRANKKGAVVSHRPFQTPELGCLRSVGAYQLKDVPSAKACEVTLLLNPLPRGVAAVTLCPVMKLKPFCLRSL